MDSNIKKISKLKKRLRDRSVAEITYPKQGRDSSGKSNSSCGWIYYEDKDGKIYSYSSKEARLEEERIRKLKGKSSEIQFLSKPSPKYTKEAKSNGFEGSLILRVTFLQNGEIGSISPVNRLPYGLTEEAIKAAREIKFKPEKRNGEAVTTYKRVKYIFTVN